MIKHVELKGFPSHSCFFHLLILSEVSDHNLYFNVNAQVSTSHVIHNRLIFKKVSY